MGGPLVRLVIAEKPSVARDLARVLGAGDRRQGFLEGSGLRISWCIGHLAQLANPEAYTEDWKKWRLDTLPMVPDPFQVEARENVKDQIEVLRRLLHDDAVKEVVNACDAGREGELIFRYLMELAGCNKPVRRLWISSLTDVAIRQGWQQLRPGSDFDALADAARCRSEADWLVGLNATRALTCACPESGGVLSVGRVQTPTLAMIVARDREIEAFVPESFWQVKLDFEAEGAAWRGTWFQPGRSEKKHGQTAPLSERLQDEAYALSLLAAAQDQVGTLQISDRKRKVEKPPLLYDLTALQQRANRRYGFSAQRTLDLAQELYEKHKLITYPRTDARFLTPDQLPGLTPIVQGLQPIAPYASTATDVLQRGIRGSKRFVDASEVGDHHAIIPTGRTPSSGLSPDLKRLFDLVARRFLAVLCKDALFDVSTLVVEVPCGQPLSDGSSEHQLYRAQGRVCVEQGWRVIDPPKSKKEVLLPNLGAGAPATVKHGKVHPGTTRAPRRFNDASLLQFMETAGRQLDDAELKRAMRRCGLGTPATRAAIMQTLLTRAYIERKGKELHSTPRGRAVVDAIPLEALKSAELTGRWEGRLAEMADGRSARPAFMADVITYTHQVVDAIRANPPPALAEPEGKVLGDCPACGKPVRERGPVYACDTGRTCAFVVFKTMAKRKISARMVGQLLKTGKTPVVKGFKSRAGKDFEAGLRWDAGPSKVQFFFEDHARTASMPDLAVGSRCPRCGEGTLIQGRSAVGCSRWREGCKFVVR